MRRRTTTLLAIAGLLLAGSGAYAHDPGMSLLEIELGPSHITAITRIAPGDRRATILSEPAVDAWIDDVALSPIEIEGAGGDEVIRFHYAPRAKDGSLRLRVRVQALGAFDPGHRRFVRVVDASGETLAERMLTQATPTFEIDLPRFAIGGVESEPGWLPPMIGLGVRHIVTGFDHLLFLAVLLLASRGIRSSAAIITGFTAAHSLTLAIAGFGWITVDPAWVEPAIAASIVVGALLNLIGNEGVRVRTAVAFGLGLVHGLGFAGLLEELASGRGAIDLRMLLEFNLGVEIGQLAIAFPFVLGLGAMRASGPGTHWIPRYGSIAMAAVGAVWFLERIDVLG